MTENNNNTLNTASQPANPEYLPVIVALNDAAFDVLSWPIRSVLTTLIEKINEVLYVQTDQAYLIELKQRITLFYGEFNTGALSRKELNQSLRHYAAWVHEGRAW